MFARLTLGLLLPATLALGATSAPAQPRPLRLVAITEPAGSPPGIGVGILRPRYTGECFVVMPRHVADSAQSGSAGPLAVDRGSSDPLTPVAERFSDDVSLWRMRRRVDRSNCPAWPSVADVNRTLERADRTRKEAFVLPWTVQGGGRPVRVLIEQLSLNRFTVRQTGEPLKQGMSGSPVQVDGMVVGILTEVILDDGLGVVLRLDYLERHLGPIFDSSPSPDDAGIYASLLLPGMGQVRTRRIQSGLFWLGLAAGPTGYLFFETRNEQVARTRPLPDGREETYFETRPVNPNRRYAWIPWLAAGLGSLIEARGHAERYHIPPERSGIEPRRRAHVRVQPNVLPDAERGTRVQVAELRF